MEVMGDGGCDFVCTSDVAADFSGGWPFDRSGFVEKADLTAGALGQKFDNVKSRGISKSFENLKCHFARHRKEYTQHFDGGRNELELRQKHKVNDFIIVNE